MLLNDCFIDFGGERIMLNKMSELLPDPKPSEYLPFEPIEMTCKLSDESKELLAKLFPENMPKTLWLKDKTQRFPYLRADVVFDTISRYKDDPYADDRSRTAKDLICDAIHLKLLEALLGLDDANEEDEQ